MVQPEDKLGADLIQVANAMLELLDARSKDVVTRRFGLKNAEKETLDSIGKEYGITRERVRQIEVNAKKGLTALVDLYQGVDKLLADLFIQHGGLMAQHHAVAAVRKHTNQEIPVNTVVFYLIVLPKFTAISRSTVFGPHWRHEPFVHPAVEQIVTEATTILANAGHPIETKELFTHLHQRLQQHQVTDAIIEAALTASLQVDPTVFGEWGLITWPETHPRGVGDKSYAVLRQHGQPAHFREITDLINQAKFDHKQANAQTVHNELIKDGRFVLVGRGMYGLKEWGYMSGTVADVLEAILREARRPLTSDELIGRVLKQRIVKKNTILLSLQNTNRFQKKTEGYTLRRA